MDRVANLASEERAELFREAGTRRGTGSAVTEKDFWVCWVLKRLFASLRVDAAPRPREIRGPSRPRQRWCGNKFSEYLSKTESISPRIQHRAMCSPE
jgi:hypothetical protein